MNIPGVSRSFAISICALAYALIPAYGAIVDGMGFDDWWLLSETPDHLITLEGRWAQHFIIEYLFAHRILISLALFLTFICLYGVSYVLAVHVSHSDNVPLYSAIIFFVGVHHIYVSDIFSFSYATLPIPLAMLLSVVAYHILTSYADSQERSRLFLAVLCASQLLALAVATYQPTAVAGFIIPLIVFAKARSVLNKAFARYILIVVTCSVLSLILYFVEFEVYQLLIGIEHVELRSTRFTLEMMDRKVASLPYQVNIIHSGTLLDVPDGLKWFNRLFFVSIVGFALAASLKLAQTPRDAGNPLDPAFASGRFLLAVAITLFVVPLIIFPFSTYTPPRALSYLGFYQVAVFLLSLNVVAQHSAGHATAGEVAGQRAGFLILATVAAVSVFVTAAAIEDRKRVNDRDLELARAVFARVTALPGYDGGPFRIVGGVDVRDLDWGDSIGRTLFLPYRGKESKYILGIFKEIYNLPWKAQLVESSPISCPAFPAEKSTFMYLGNAYVCLTEQTAKP